MVSRIPNLSYMNVRSILEINIVILTNTKIESSLGTLIKVDFLPHSHWFCNAVQMDRMHWLPKVWMLQHTGPLKVFYGWLVPHGLKAHGRTWAHVPLYILAEKAKFQLPCISCRKTLLTPCWIPLLLVQSWMPHFAWKFPALSVLLTLS